MLYLVTETRTFRYVVEAKDRLDAEQISDEIYGVDELIDDLEQDAIHHASIQDIDEASSNLLVVHRDSDGDICRK